MGFFKRLCLFVFGLAGLLALAALAMPWYGPWTQEATALLGVDEYFMTVEVLVAVTGMGCLISLLRSIFTRNHKTVVIAKSGGDQITVTRDAIASQATHVIEEDGEFKARRVNVRAKKRGHVRVFARVQPTVTVDTVVAGEELHQRLVAGLTTICGDNVDSVELEFLNAQEYAHSQDDFDYDALAANAGMPRQEEAEASDVPAGHDESHGSPTDDAEIASEEGAAIADDEPDETGIEPAAASAGSTRENSEITVPMGHHGASGSETAGRE